VLLHPAANPACSAAWSTYAGCLGPEPHAEERTLEDVVAALAACWPEPWVADLSARYLDFDQVAVLGV